MAYARPLLGYVLSIGVALHIAPQLLGCTRSVAVALRMCAAAVELHTERRRRSPYVLCSYGLQAERRCQLSAAVAHGLCTAVIELHAERRHRSPHYTAATGPLVERRRRFPYVHGSR